MLGDTYIDKSIEYGLVVVEKDGANTLTPFAEEFMEFLRLRTSEGDGQNTMDIECQTYEAIQQSFASNAPGLYGIFVPLTLAILGGISSLN
jgi:hypothetical protein